MFLAGVCLVGLVSLVYGVRFNAPPVVSMDLFTNPWTPIDDMEARHLENSPLLVWLGHVLQVRSFAAWVVFSTALSGLATLALIAFVWARYTRDRARGLALLLLAISPVFFHVLGWSAKADALWILALLGLYHARSWLSAGLCAALMILALPVEGLVGIGVFLVATRPHGGRLGAIVGGAAIGLCAHAAYLAALGDPKVFGWVAKGFLPDLNTLHWTWVPANVWLSFGWFWLVIGYVAVRRQLTRSQVVLLGVALVVCLLSTVPNRPVILVALPVIFSLIDRVTSDPPRLGRALTVATAALAFIQIEAAYGGPHAPVRLHILHWPGTTEQIRVWAGA